MNIKQYILKVLSSKEIINMLPNKKVFFLHAIDKEDNPLKTPYIEYEVVNEYGVAFSEGNEEYTTYIVQVDIFSKTDYTKLESIVKNLMIENNFSRDRAVDLYEKETGLNHKAMRFNISLPTSEN